jgi:hypothetical protein
MPRIRMLQERNVRTGFVDGTMIDAILGKLPEALCPVVRFAYVTGWRDKARFCRSSGDLSTERPERCAWTPARRRTRLAECFLFTDTLKTLIDDLWAEHEVLTKTGMICPFVFHRNGKRIRSLKKSHGPMPCTAAGYPGKLIHDLRRSAVQNMERAGLSRSVAMQLTGHKTEAVYRRHAIMSEADLREGVARLNGLGETRGKKSEEQTA